MPDQNARGLAAYAKLKTDAIISSGNTTSLTFAQPLTLPAGSQAQLQNLGTITNPIIQLEIPRGATGEPGKDGVKVEFRAANGYVQLKYADSYIWENLIALSDITGRDGIDGQDGLSPEISVAEQTSTEYVLKVTTADGSFLTPNLKGQDGVGGGTSNHNELIGRDLENQHPISAIIGLSNMLANMQAQIQALSEQIATGNYVAPVLLDTSPYDENRDLFVESGNNIETLEGFANENMFIEIE